MAKVPFEILCIGHHDITPIENAISLLNKQQDVFTYSILRNIDCEAYSGEKKNRYTTTEIYELFDNVIHRLKGYHPHVIGVVHRCLDGEKLCNLFGSMQASDNRLTGKAITSLWGVKQIFGSVPVDVYLIFEFLSFAIRFVVGRGMIHDESRLCIFDKKTHKLDIVPIMKSGKFCDDCYERVSSFLDDDQMISINRIVNIIGDICRSENPKKALEKQMKADMPKIFLSHSSKDKKFVRRLAEDLADNNCRVWFYEWKIKIGENIVEKISKGISGSDYMALIISKSSIESSWVLNEWTSMFVKAGTEKKAKILPILIEDVEIPAILKPYRYADFRDPRNYEHSLEGLLNDIKEYEEYNSIKEV